MRNKKRMLALALAATLTLGCSMTALADDANTGNTTGTGTTEGHVEKKVTNVTLPTVTGTPFSYTVDPEGLIGETSGGKYNAVFPAAASDTGVYFLVGKDETDTSKDKYENTSSALEVINKSSHDIQLTVKAEVDSPKATDMPLVEKSAIATSSDAAIYLGLVVDTETAVAVSKDQAATKTVTIAGTPANFKTAVKADKSGYEYRALTLDEYKAANSSYTGTDLPWNKSTLKVEGSATKSKAISADTTAPALKVTWSWKDPSAEVTGHVEYTDNSWWIAKSASEKFSDSAVLGDVTINGTKVNASLQSYDGGKWVVVTWANYVAAGLDQSETQYEIKAVVDGTTYVVNHTYGS